MKNNLYNKIITLIFILFLSLSFIGLAFGITSTKENTEWRKLAEFPKINTQLKLNEFPKKFEQFYNDNFGLRNILLRINATIYFGVFNQSPAVGVIKNSKDWYFHNEPRFMAPNYSLYYDHIIFSDQQLSAIGDIFLADKMWLNQKNIPYLFVIVPDKEVIYPEYFPYPEFINSKIQLSQILGVLNAKGIPTMYLGPNIAQAKKLSDVAMFYRQDAHWSSVGAFYGYQALMQRLKEYFPYSESLTLSDFDIKVDSVSLPRGFDLNRLKSLMTNISDSAEPVLDFQVKDGVLDKINKIDKVVIYADSYFVGDPARNYLGGSLNYLRYNFKNIVVIDDSLWGLEKSKIEQEKPSIVIREIIQRNLYKYYAQTGIKD